MKTHKRTRITQTFAQWGIGLLIPAISSTVFSSTAFSQPIPKKLIELGWDKPDTATLRKNLAEMEQTPLNGVMINVTGTDDEGKTVRMSHAFVNQHWKQEWFQCSVDDLRAIDSRKLSDNFVQLTANPGNVDWFDDEGWKQIVDHWRIAAWIAKEGGLKGIAFDPEPYVKPHRQFMYAMQPQRNQHSFDEYEAKARQRGQEIIKAVAAVDPNLVIFSVRLLSNLTSAAQSASPQTAIRAAGYWNLCPALMNGWLDEAPASMVFVEGCESQGYRGNSEYDFLKAGNEIRNSLLSLIAPENRQKYMAQVQVSFGIYLDAYTNSPSSSYYIDPKGLTVAQRLHQNVRYAASVANEYVWLYGEDYRWWPTTNKSVKAQSWSDIIPGINEALSSAVDPHSSWLASQKIAAAQEKGALVNLLENGDFSAGSTNASNSEAAKANDWKSVGAPANWSTWQAGGLKGTFSQDNAVNHDASNGGAISRHFKWLHHSGN